VPSTLFFQRKEERQESDRMREESCWREFNYQRETKREERQKSDRVREDSCWRKFNNKGTAV
jgi:hypothetical protein